MQTEFLENISQNLGTFSQKAKDKVLDEPEALKLYLHWMLSMYEENADLIRLYLQMSGEFSFIDKLQHLVEENLLNNYYPSLDLKNSKIPAIYLNAALFATDMYIAIEWLKHGCVEPADDMVEYMMEINTNGIFSTLAVPGSYDTFSSDS
ncbi:MAG: TetR family transcriptional regulator C-terminal domain-containing protein [Lachnospiraceae bacterium]|nr:TetR family transcriptional regulator C-terminal domain-containing protein [Lachnospiraceae bacterium]